MGTSFEQFQISKRCNEDKLSVYYKINARPSEMHILSNKCNYYGYWCFLATDMLERTISMLDSYRNKCISFVKKKIIILFKYTKLHSFVKLYNFKETKLVNNACHNS